MRLHRFYIKKDLGSDRTLLQDRDLMHQWRSVFRYNVGSEVVLFDGRGSEYLYVIETINNREAWVRLLEERGGVVPKNKISLYISLIKKDNLELVIEKATELGVSKIIPILSERSEKKGFNLERAKRIAIEASEQCGRADVPEINSIKQLADSIEETEGGVIILEPSSTSPLTPLLAKKRGTENYNLESVNLFIGPEGGWSPKELDLFKQKEAQVYSLGSLVLRAETAAIAALSLLVL